MAESPPTHVGRLTAGKAVDSRDRHGAGKVLVRDLVQLAQDVDRQRDARALLFLDQRGPVLDHKKARAVFRSGCGTPKHEEAAVGPHVEPGIP